jgi:heterodisulfide reductase subunit A
MKRGKRIGVYICHCGRNIAGYVDVEELTKKVQELKWVSIVRQEKYMCSEQGQKTIKRDLREGLVDRVIVAACTPTMHEKTFRRCVSEAGLNPFLYQQVNIRENCSWVTEDKEQATEKAFKLIKGAVWRVRFLEPLFQLEYPVVPSCLIIGGGVAGITAALEISSHFGGKRGPTWGMGKKD